MGQLAESIRALTAQNLLSGRKNKAADLRVICEGIAEAVESLEATPRGSTVLRGTGAPNNAVGIAGDFFIDIETADLYFKEGEAWQPLLQSPGTDIPADTAHYPSQSPATTGRYLQSTGVAGNEQWAALRMALSFQFFNLTERGYRFFNATTITRIVKDAGVSTLSYSVNGAAAVPVLFAGDVFTGSLAIPAGAFVAWVITYANGTNEAYFDVEGLETFAA